LRYIKGTLDTVLYYGGSESTARDYVYSNFAGDLKKRKFNIGYMFTIAGGGVS
jgi:hypothetical protein